MREINNNNLDMTKIQSTNLKRDVREVVEVPVCSDVQEQSVSDFSNPTAEVLGRSQVTAADNLKSDLDFAKANPEVVSKSDKLFELALSSLQADGDPDAYEKACAIATSSDAKVLLS